MINWNEYPYTDFHELNLDWVLKMIKSLDAEMDSFVNVNTIKYADPLLWNITSQYEQNTLVQDATGNTYLSKKPVPTGIPITNTEYWLKVADFSGTADVIRKSIADANDEASTTTSADRAVGELVWLSGFLYEVIRPMEAGDAYIFTGNPNVTKITIERLINRLTAADEAINGRINDEIQNRTNADTALNESLNEEISNRKGADDAITDLVNTLSTNFNTLKDNIASHKFVYPEDFGAVGDGVHDDTQAIIDALNSDISDYVYFHGIYHTTKSISVPDNKHLIAYGGFSGAYFTDQFETGTFNVSNSFNVFFSGLTFLTHRGKHTSNDYCIYANSDYANMLTGLNINNCWMIEGNANNDNVKFVHLEGFFNIIHINNVLLDAGITNGGVIELIGDAQQAEIHDVNMSNIFFDALNSTGSNLYLKNIKEAEIMNCVFRVETTPYNIYLDSDGKITTANLDHCTLISAKNDINVGKVHISTGCIVNDRNSARWLITFENLSIYNRLYNQNLIGIYSPSLGVLVNNPDIYDLQTGGYSFKLSTSSDRTNKGVGFIWNTAKSYYFKYETLANDEDVKVGCGLISNINKVSRLVVPDTDIVVNSVITPNSISSENLPVELSVESTGKAKQCYKLIEIPWNNSAEITVLDTIYINHVSDPIFRVDIDHTSLITSMYVSNDLISWTKLFETNGAGYDVIGIGGFNKSNKDYNVSVNGIWH